LKKEVEMAVIRTMGAVIVVLVVLWLIFALIHVVTAILDSVFVVLIVLAICYALYHHFKKH
jgi:hypothetical protein